LNDFEGVGVLVDKEGGDVMGEETIVGRCDEVLVSHGSLLLAQHVGPSFYIDAYFPPDLQLYQPQFNSSLASV
jgi:hypothetical protein